MAEPAAPEAPIHATLDAFHHAAAVADEAAYFGAMTEDFVFVGTDASERWTRAAFETFARPHFEKESAWVYTSVERHVSVRGDVAWFDERLRSASYGETRGSGVLIRQGESWKIAQYVLSFPIPNAIAADVVKSIQAATETSQ